MDCDNPKAPMMHHHHAAAASVSNLVLICFGIATLLREMTHSPETQWEERDARSPRFHKGSQRNTVAEDIYKRSGGTDKEFEQPML